MGFNKEYFALFLFAFIICSCDENKHVKSYRLPKTSFNISKNEAPKDIQKSINGISWDLPQNWVPSDGHSMRLASFDVPFSRGIGDLSIVSLGSESGGLIANVNRWRKQIDLGPISESEIKTESIVGQSKSGSFRLFRLVNDSSQDKAILAAVLPMQGTTLFIKLTASQQGIIELETTFTQFCSSIDKVQ